MQINKFKKVGKNKYKIIFDNTELLLYEDIILKYNLLIKKDIDEVLLDEIISENSYYDAYDKSLSYIEAKLRTKREIIDLVNTYNYKLNSVSIDAIKNYKVKKIKITIDILWFYILSGINLSIYDNNSSLLYFSFLVIQAIPIFIKPPA